MIIFPLINYESRWATFISNTLTNILTKHHHWTLHIIIHQVFESRYERDLIDNIKPNLRVCYNLNSVITFNRVDLTTYIWKTIVLLPQSRLSIYFEKENRSWRAHYKSLFEQKIHWSKIWICKLLVMRVHIWLHCYCKALTIKSKIISGNFAVKWFYWEIHFWASFMINCNWFCFTYYLFFSKLIDKIILNPFNSMVNTYKHIFIR